MNLNEYQKLAKRTECPQPVICKPGGETAFVFEHSALLHAAIGIGGESGEINACIQRYFWYNRPLNVTNLIEEIGDLSWYIAEACNALDLNWEDSLIANIAKLRQRYPEKYSDLLAAEENRDRAREGQVMPTPLDEPKLGEKFLGTKVTEYLDTPRLDVTVEQIVKALETTTSNDEVVKTLDTLFFSQWSELDLLRPGEVAKLKADIRGLVVALVDNNITEYRNARDQ